MNLNRTAPIFDRTQRLAQPVTAPKLQPAAMPKPAAPAKSASQPMPQDRFLVRMLEEKRPVDLHLQNGESFCRAVITQVDKYALTVVLGERQVCILKHALAWVEPAAKNPNP